MAKPSLRTLTTASVIMGVGLFGSRFKKAPISPEGIRPDQRATHPENLPVKSNSDLSLLDRRVGTCQTARVEPDLLSSAIREPALRAPKSSRNVAMPLVFQEFNKELWNLNDQQVAVIDELRSRFLADIGGLNQNPNDPGYLEKWQKAQPEIDAELWFKLGKDFFQEAQLQAYASESFTARAE